MFAQDFPGFSTESPHPSTPFTPKQTRIIGHSKGDLGGCPSPTGRTVFYSHACPFPPSLCTQTRQHVVSTAVGSQLTTTREAGLWTTHGRSRANDKQQNRVTVLVVHARGPPYLCALINVPNVYPRLI